MRTIPWPSRHWAGLYIWKGKTVDALAEFQKAAALDDLPWYKGSLGYAYAASGDRAKAEQILRDLDEMAKKQYVSPASRASVYLGLAKKLRLWIGSRRPMKTEILFCGGTPIGFTTACATSRASRRDAKS